MKWLIVAIAVFQGAWLTFDGGRALVVGDYVTRDGRLGPWARVVSMVGVDPRGGLMKWVHVVLGAGWLVGALVFTFRQPIGWYVILTCAVATLWYLPVGTVLSSVQLVLLFLPPVRNLS